MKKKADTVGMSIAIMFLMALLILTLSLYLLYQRHDLKNEIKLVEQEKVLLQGELEKRERDVLNEQRQKRELERHVSNLNDEKKAITEKLEKEIQTTKAQNTELEKAKSELGVEKLELQTRLEITERSLQDLEGKIYFLTYHLSEMEESLKESQTAARQEEIEHLQGLNAKLEELKAELESEKKDLLERLARMEQSQRSLEGEIHFLNLGRIGLEEKLEGKELEIRELRANLEKANEEKRSLEGKLYVVRIDLMGLQKGLEIKDQAFKTLEGEFFLLKNRNARLTEAHKELEETLSTVIANLQRENKTLMEKVFELEGVLEKEQETTDSQKERIGKLLEERKMTVKEGDSIWSLFVRIHRINPTWEQVMMIAERNDLVFRVKDDQLTVLIYPSQRLDLSLSD